MPSEQPIGYAFGEIVLIRFPFTNQTDFKQRPAVIVSNAAYNRERPDIVLMAVTSQLVATLSSGDTLIDNWQLAGLLKPSAVKPIFTTVEQSLIVRRLGILHETDAIILREAIQTMLG